MDLMLGSKVLLGSLPHLDRLLKCLFNPLEERLNRSHRSHTTLRNRAVLVQALLVPGSYFIGSFANHLATTPYIGPPIAVLVIARSIGLRQQWDITRASLLEIPPHAGKLRHAGEQLIMSYSRDWICNLTLFVAGGFALLLPFRLLAAALDQHTASDSTRPSQPFKSAFVPFFNLLAIPGTMVSCFFLALAPVLVPGSSLSAVRGTIPAATSDLRGILSRLIPLSIVAYAVGISFSCEGKDGTVRWIGPPDGRANIVVRDLRTIVLYFLATSGLTLLAMAMLGISLILLQNGRY
ncbi:hypothetical protein [Kordiimonas sp.]|uniref:hypothetical protein n=1 Tax=Kordiimonas sp. TaxID=1970157 RepID=UPI003A93D4D0